MLYQEGYCPYCFAKAKANQDGGPVRQGRSLCENLRDGEASLCALQGSSGGKWSTGLQAWRPSFLRFIYRQAFVHFYDQQEQVCVLTDFERQPKAFLSAKCQGEVISASRPGHVSKFGPLSVRDENVRKREALITRAKSGRWWTRQRRSSSSNYSQCAEAFHACRFREERDYCCEHANRQGNG